MAKPFDDRLKNLPERNWSDLECAHDDDPPEIKDSEQIRRWLSSGESSVPSKKKILPKRGRTRGSIISAEELKEAIEKAVAPLRKEIAVLQAAIKEPTPSEPGEFERWIRSREAQKYAREFIACTGSGSVVAHSPDNDELLDLIANHPNGDELVIDLVPSA